MGNLDGRHIAWRHDHPHSQPGRTEQVCGEVEGQPDAAMGRRISWQEAAVERDARPGDALHVGHVCIVIEVRVVLRFLLDDAEDAGGRLASLLAARNRRPQDPPVGVIDGDPLVAQRNDGHDRLAGGARPNGLDRVFAPSACGAGRFSRSDQRGQTHNGKTRGPHPCLLVFRALEPRRHASSHPIVASPAWTQETHNVIRSNLPTRNSPVVSGLTRAVHPIGPPSPRRS